MWQSNYRAQKFTLCSVFLLIVTVIHMYSFPFCRELAKNPGFWSRVCLHNMAKLGKEATTTRRVLESLFRYFDHGNLWSPEHGVACPVLEDMQAVMESLGKWNSWIYIRHKLIFILSLSHLK